MHALTFSGKDKDEALQKARHMLRLPEDAFEVLNIEDQNEEMLEGAEPLEVRIRVAVKQDYLANRAREVLAQILKLMGIPALVSISKERGLILLEVQTTEQRKLLARRAETLNSLEHLLNRMVTRSEKDLPLIVIDCNAYKAERIRRLERIARKAANEASASGREVSLRPMPSDERKLIHNFVKQFPKVYSYSQGVERDRRVIVAPERTAQGGKADFLSEMNM